MKCAYYSASSMAIQNLSRKNTMVKTTVDNGMNKYEKEEFNKTLKHNIVPKYPLFSRSSPMRKLGENIFYPVQPLALKQETVPENQSTRSYTGSPITLKLDTVSRDQFPCRSSCSHMRTSSITQSEKNIYYSGSSFPLHKINKRSRRWRMVPIVERPPDHFGLHLLAIATTETRKNTFLFTWPQQSGKWWPHMLAEAGFFYLGTALDLQCFECKVKTSVEHWHEKEKPEQAHSRINPNCPYVKRKGYTPMTSKEQNTLNLSQKNKELKHANGNDRKVDVDFAQTNCASTQPSPPAKTIEPDCKGTGAFNGNRKTINGIQNNPPITVENENSASNFRSNFPDRRIQNGDMSRGGNDQESQLKHSLQTITDSMNSQLTMDASNEPEYKYPQYKTCPARQRSFSNWRFSQKQTPEALSKAGYFYTGENDIVRCFCCDLGLAEWDPKDDPWTEHARHNPRCWFLKKEKGQEYIQQITQDWRRIYNPKHAAFDDKESRIATFDDWRTDIEQTPQILADAGFFFIGEEDVVRCHYCDGGLRHWEPGDVPWEEHARWFPFCKFVIKMKGRQYIDEIKTKTEERQRAATLSETPSVHNNGNYNVHHPVLKKLQSYGLPEADISRAAHEYIRRNGNSNFNEDELMTLIYDKENHHQQNQRKSFSGQNVLTVDTPAERDPEKLIEINRKLKEKLKCVRCRTNEICMLFVNCGHRLTCETCAYKMDFCPHCDTRIKKRLKTFLS